MRARYIYGTSLKNILVLTFTRSLQDFIRMGVKGKKGLDEEQIMTFARWARGHVGTYAPSSMAAFDKTASFEDQIKQMIGLLKIANERVGGKNLYDAILVDEVQDLNIDQVKILCQLSERITVAGDTKQMVYESGETIKEIEALGFKKTVLKYHYRIGTAIADVADKALQPVDDADRLRTNCNYPEAEQRSKADLLEFSSRDEQFAAMFKSIELQLRSYPGEGIGVIVPKAAMADELKSRFDQTSLASQVAFHNDDSPEHSFQSGKPIHVIVLKSAKGTEFRAVHIFGLEELRYPQHRRELLFTAITRAKTSLTGYHTGKVIASVATAFAKSQIPPALADLL